MAKKGNNIPDFVRGKRKGVQQVREIKRHKLPVTKLMSHIDEMYRMKNIVNYIIILLYDDRW